MRIFVVAVGLFLLGVQPTAAHPPFKVRIQLNKSEYVAGEPMRLTVFVRNTSDTTQVAACPGGFESHATLAIQSKRAPLTYRGITNRFQGATLAPGDSIRFSLQIEAPRAGVDSCGVRVSWRHVPDIFRQPGSYGIQLRLRLWLPRQRSATFVSNHVAIKLKPPTRAEQRILDALWNAHVIGEETYWWAVCAETFGHLKQESADALRRVEARYHDHAISQYARFAVISTAPDSWMMRSAGFYLLREDCPAFLPDLVARRMALSAVAAAELEGRWQDLDRAAQAMEEVLRHDPSLRADPDFMFAWNRVHERDGDVAMRLWPAKRDVVIGEPLYFRMTVFNDSRYDINVPSSRDWQPDDDSFEGYFEIESPDGRRELRTSPMRVISCGIDNLSYSGVPLAPGDSIICSWHIRDSVGLQGSSRGHDYRPLFKRAGVHRLRAGFRIPSRYFKLSGRGRTLLSLPVEIRVHEPDSVESRILAALPSDRLSASRPETRPQMEAVIEAYPEHPLTMHVRAALSQSFRWGAGADGERSVQLLDRAMEQAPLLWREDLLLDRLRLCPLVPGQSDSICRDVFDEAVAMMAARPGLWTDSRYASVVVMAGLREYGVDAAGHARSWWDSKVRWEGPSVPSWEDLRNVAASAPPQYEFVGPVAPRKEVSRRNHIRR